MGQFKPMVKMMTTEPTVELKLKKGGSVKKAMGGMMGAPMDASMASSMPARGGMMPVARPKRPSMAMRRAAMAGMKGMGAMKEGGESKATHKAEMSKMKGLEKELKSHEGKPASKAHKGLKAGGMAMVEKDGKMVPDFAADGKGKMKKGGMACATGGIVKSTKPGGYATGGVVNGQGGYKKGGAIAKNGIINTEGQGGEYRNTKMVTAKPDNNSAPTGEVKLGNGGGYKKGGKIKGMMGGGMMSNGMLDDGMAGGYKKGGASKKHFATGGAVNNSGHAVAYPAKKPSAPVSNDRQSGTFKKGGSVTPAQKKEQSAFKSENATAMKQAKAQSNLKYQDGGKVTDLSKGAYDKSIGPSESDMDMAKAIRNIPSRLMEGAKSLFGSGTMSNKDRDAIKNAGSVTKTEKSVTVTPARKRGGAVKC
jgi:hypothetical protein